MDNTSADAVYGRIDPALLEGVNQQQAQAIANWNAYVQFQQAMNDIIASMKEIPVLPSEVPNEDDKFNLLRVEMPETGGVLTYMDKMKNPYRGFPYTEFVDKIDTVKKIAKGSLSGLYHSFRSPSSILLVLPAIMAFRQLFTAGVYTFWRLIERYRIKPFRFSGAMRELYRAFTAPQDDKPRIKELRLMLRDLICMILEFDNAYRFRAQDILAELNKESLVKNPIKELNRLADIAIGREKEQQVKDTWKLIKMFNSFYLRFDRSLLKMLVGVLSNLELEQIKLTDEDIEYCKPRKDYTFGFTQ